MLLAKQGSHMLKLLTSVEELVITQRSNGSSEARSVKRITSIHPT